MRLRKERKAAKLTQAELARRSKVTQGTISRIESGDMPKPSFEVLNRLAIALQRAGRIVSEAQLQPRRQPLLVRGARCARSSRARVTA